MNYDIVYLELIENTHLEIIEDIYSSLNVDTLYICKKVSTKQEIINFKNLKINSSKLKFEKIYIISNLNLISNLNSSDLVFSNTNTIEQNNQFLKNKKLDYLLNPFSKTLCFDEGSCNLCKTNNIGVCFNYNYLQNNYRFIKQAIFILNLLKIHYIPVIFGSFAKNIYDIKDSQVVVRYLTNFGFEKETLNKFLSGELCLKRK